MFQESKESFSKLFEHMVLNEKETESNWGNIALAAIEAYSKRSSTHVYIGVYNTILSSKTGFSHNVLNNGVTLRPSW